MPRFPIGLGGSEEQVLRWADDFDAVAYLSKGAEAFGTEDIPWAKLSKEQRLARGLRYSDGFRLALQATAGHTAITQRIRAMLADRDQHQHGALARL